MTSAEETLRPEIPRVAAPEWWIVLAVALGTLLFNVIVRVDEYMARRAEEQKPFLDQVEKMVR
jgi:hypothetical protein